MSALTHHVVLLGHGARNPAWAQPFEKVAAHLQGAWPSLKVHLAFLELMPPDLGTVLAQIAHSGAQRVDVLPLFLGGAGHVLRDVPPIISAAQAAHGLEIQLHGAIGQQEAMAKAMAAVCAGMLGLVPESGP
jgi:sirohydrochlorin cobaltochelatase